MSGISINASKALAIAQNAKKATLEKLIAETDYKALKHADGALTDDAYAATKTYRANLRAAYNSVEACTTVSEVEAVTIPSA